MALALEETRTVRKARVPLIAVVLVRLREIDVGLAALLKAGQVLTTGVRARDGTYLMFVEKGQALIFTTDFNNNGQIDFNEITGIQTRQRLNSVVQTGVPGFIAQGR